MNSGPGNAHTQKAREWLVSLYSVGILLGLVFLGTNLTLIAYSISVQNWAWLVILALVSLIDVPSLFVPYTVARALGNRRFLMRVQVSLTGLFVFFWLINIAVEYVYSQRLWVL